MTYIIIIVYKLNLNDTLYKIIFQNSESNVGNYNSKYHCNQKVK